MQLIKESNNTHSIDSLNEKLSELLTYKERIFEMSLKKMISDEEFVNRNSKIMDDISTVKKNIIKLETNKESSKYYEDIANSISKEIKPKLDVKSDIGKYFNLFIDKVLVSKINNDRRHLKLDIIFNFKKNNEELEYDDNNYDDHNNQLDVMKEINPVIKGCMTNRDYSMRLSFIN